MLVVRSTVLGILSSQMDILHYPLCPFAAAQGAVVMPLMKRGFSIGLIKFNLITARKPEQRA